MQPEYNNFAPQNRSFIGELLHSKKAILLILGALALIVLCWLAWAQLLNKKTITLRPNPGTTITIGTPSINTAGGSIYTVLARTSSNRSIRLKRGIYEVLYEGKDYISQYQPLTLKANIVLTTLQLNYSLSKLDSLLDSSKPAIHTALSASTNMSTYTLANEKLYLDGSWYAAQLIPTDQINQDRMIVILHQQKGNWKLVAGPKITLFIGDYPGIPQSLIRTINNLPYNP